LGTTNALMARSGEADAANALADERYQTARNNQLLIQGRLAQDRVQSELDQRKFLAGDYQRNVGNAVRGGLFQGMQDVNITPPAGITMGQITGGARPSAIANKDVLGRALQERAMQQMQNPDPLMPIPDVPELGVPDSATGSSVKRNLGTGTAIATAMLPVILDAYSGRRTTTNPTTTNPTAVTAPYPSATMRNTTFR